MDKQNVGMLFGLKQEGHSDTRDNMDEPGKHSKRNKPGSKGQILSDAT